VGYDAGQWLTDTFGLTIPSGSNWVLDLLRYATSAFNFVLMLLPAIIPAIVAYGIWCAALLVLRGDPDPLFNFLATIVNIGLGIVGVFISIAELVWPLEPLFIYLKTLS
jgi:hypothetical protein